MNLEITVEEIRQIVSALKYGESVRARLIRESESEKEISILKSIIERDNSLARKLLKTVTEEKKKNNPGQAANPVV